MYDGKEQVPRLTQVQRAAAVGFISILFFSFPFLLFISILSLNYHFSAGMKGSGGALPSSRLAQRRRGY
jgi:hypothetical protein